MTFFPLTPKLPIRGITTTVACQDEWKWLFTTKQVFSEMRKVNCPMVTLFIMHCRRYLRLTQNVILIPLFLCNKISIFLKLVFSIDLHISIDKTFYYLYLKTVFINNFMCVYVYGFYICTGVCICWNERARNCFLTYHPLIYFRE